MAVPLSYSPVPNSHEEKRKIPTRFLANANSKNRFDSFDNSLGCLLGRQQWKDRCESTAQETSKILGVT